MQEPEKHKIPAKQGCLLQHFESDGSEWPLMNMCRTACVGTLLAAFPLTSLASVQELEFSGSVVGVASDGGLAEPANASIGANVSGRFSFDTDWISTFEVPSSITAEGASWANIGFHYAESQHSVSLSIGGANTFGESSTLGGSSSIQSELYFIDDFESASVAGGARVDLVLLQFDLDMSDQSWATENSYGRFDFYFIDATATAYSGILESGWILDLSLFDTVEATALFSQDFQFLDPFDPASLEPLNYYRLHMNMSEVASVPVPAAAPLFFFALATLVGTKRIRSGAKPKLRS